MSEYRAKNETALMYIFFCSFLIVSNLIFFTVSEISGTSFAYQIINSIRTLISCAVYGFVFVNGYKKGICEDNTPQKKLFPAIKKLLSPYIVAVATYWIVMILLGGTEIKPLALLKVTFSYHFYIVLVVFQFIILSSFLTKIINRFNILSIIIASLIISMVSVALIPRKIYQYVFSTYLLCYIIGYFLGKKRDTFLKYSETNFLKILFIYVVTLIVAESISIIYVFSSNNLIVVLKQIITCIYSPVALVFILAISIKLGKKDFCQNIHFKSLSKSTYFIFLWHMLPIIATSQILAESEEISELGSLVISSIATAIFVIIIAYSAYRKGIKNGTV